MSFYPLATDASFAEWSKHIELWRAAQERMLAVGALVWPFDGKVWDWGIITAVTNTTVTIGGKTWQTSPKRWVSWNGTGLGGELEVAPANYDLVIGGRLDSATYRPEPWEVIQAHIIDQPSGNTVTLDKPLTNWVTTRQVRPSTSGPGAISDLVGRRAFIKKRGQWNFGDRWPQWHNNGEHYFGRADGPGTDSTHIEDLGLRDRVGHEWADGELIGREVIFETDPAGEMRRCAISGNTARRFTFANPSGGTIGANGPYTVVTAGAGPARPDRPHYSPLGVWYWGHAPLCWTSHIDPLPNPPWSFGHLGPVALPREYALNWMEETSPGVCGVVTKYALDIDLWTAIDAKCLTKDESWAPFMWRTLRGMQVFCLDACGFFVELEAHAGAKSIRNYVPATLLHRANVNAFAGTTGSLVSPIGTSPNQTSNRITVTGVSLPAGAAYPCPVFFAIRNPIDEVARYNNSIGGTHPDAGKRQYGTLSQSGGVVTLQFDDAAGVGSFLEFNELHQGQPVVFSLGFSRPPVPYILWHLYDRTVFIPDTDDDGNAVTTPTEEFPGHYEMRAKSTTYADHTVEGDLYDGGEAFVTGRVAWYVGDTWDQPGPWFGRTIYDGTSASLPEGAANLVNFIERGPGVADRPDYLASLAGHATEAGTTTLLRDDTKTWAATTATHAGTATGGGTTTLTDTTQAVSSFWDGTGGRWAGHMIRVQDSGGAWHRRPVTSYNPATQQHTFPALPFAVTAGTPYEIAEFQILNRWAGRKVRITRPRGWTHDATLTHSDDSTIVWTPAAPGAIQPGDTFRITEQLPGAKLKWDGTEHVAPTGNDPRTGAAWAADPRFNHPYARKEFGLAMRLDYHAGAPGDPGQQRNEVAACLAVMKEFQVAHVWKHHPTDVDATNNFPNFKVGETICGWNDWDGVPYDPAHAGGATGSSVTEADWRWDNATPTESDNAPLCWSHGSVVVNAYGVADHYLDAGYESRFAWGAFSLGYGIPFDYTATYYAHAIIPGKIPVVGGHVDPIGDAPLHPTPIDSLGNDLLDIGPGTDGNAPNLRTFNANGSGLAMRQFTAWHSYSGAAGDTAHTTSAPLGDDGSGGFVKPALVPQPTSPASTTSADYMGYIVNKSTVVIAPTFLFCT